MHNQGIKFRTVFGGKDLGHGIGIQGIRPKSVNRLRGQCHQFTSLKQRYSLLNHFFLLRWIGSIYDTCIGHAGCLPYPVENEKLNATQTIKPPTS